MMIIMPPATLARESFKARAIAAPAAPSTATIVVMLTPTSAPRESVLNEISFALDEGKPLLAVYLEDTELPPGLRLRISRKQAILKYNMTDEEYDFKYIEAFLRFGLKRRDAQPVPAEANVEPAAKPGDGVTIKQLDELVKNYLGTNE